MPDVYDQRQVPIAVVSVMFSDEHQLPAISVITDQCQVSRLCQVPAISVIIYLCQVLMIIAGTSDQCHY